MYIAKILNHSVNPHGNVELVSFEVEYPHAVHKDIMTHRWARNFQSFRAFPPEKVIQKILADPFRPEVFSERVQGMGRGREIAEQRIANTFWDDHISNALLTAKSMLELGIAKEQVNFVLQDLTWIRGIITTTMPQLVNFFNLRLDLDENGSPRARPEVHRIASMMKNSYDLSTPVEVQPGDWHLPYISQEDQDNYGLKVLLALSVARCARISYLTHDGVRDPQKDIALCDKLRNDGHMSPFEHQGQAIYEPWFDALQTGSFGFGWRQYRKTIAGEAVYSGS